MKIYNLFRPLFILGLMFSFASGAYAENQVKAEAISKLLPIWRRWGNLENQTVAASEYTVWETIAPAASVCGYLLTPTGTPPPVRPAPADDVRKLPGYWAMP